MVAWGQPALKSRTVSVLRMRELTKAHQPDTETIRCLMLHEIAHAVHDQILGWDNAIVIAAFKQASDRKFYNKDDYLMTNEKEFFAELSCAYFDQLEYYPRTRDELKKVDTYTYYRLMQATWGSAAAPKKATPAKKKSTPKASLSRPNTPFFAAHLQLWDRKPRSEWLESVEPIENGATLPYAP